MISIAGTDKYGEHLHSSMYYDMWTNIPKEAFEYDDYTYEEHLGKLIPSYVTVPVIRDYLEGKTIRLCASNALLMKRTSMIMAWSLSKWQTRQKLQQNSILFDSRYIPLSFDGQKYTFCNFYFGCGPWNMGWHDHQICILEIILIFSASCMFYFYTHGSSIYTFRQLDTCLTTIITTNTYIYTVDASTIV